MSTISQDSLAQVLEDAMEARISDLHVCLPGQIQSYDSTTGLAQVQPCLMRKFQDGTVIALPIVTNVPVAYPRTKSAYVHLPIAAGDYCMLVFSERSLDVWLSNGGVVDPADSRKHHLSDAFAIPGGWPQSNKATIPNGNDLILGNGSATIQVQKSGTFLMKGAGQEVFDLIDQLLQALIQATTQDPLTGPTPFTTTTIQTLTTLKTNWDTLKGS